MEQILFYHIWGLQTFWPSDLNNVMNNPHMRGLIRAIAGCFEYFIIAKLLIEHHLQFQSFKGATGARPGL